MFFLKWNSVQFCCIWNKWMCLCDAFPVMHNSCFSPAFSGQNLCDPVPLFCPCCFIALLSCSLPSRFWTVLLHSFMTLFVYKTELQDRWLAQDMWHMGLYYFHSPTAVACTSIESLSRLHRCFGNSSLNKLKAIVLGLSKLQSLDCESCLLVKHVRATILARDPHHTNSPFARPFRYLGL